MYLPFYSDLILELGLPSPLNVAIVMMLTCVA
jgi:hypothetical protein